MAILELEGLTKQELMRMAEGLGVAIVAILVILLVIRPLINNAFEVSNNNSAEKLISANTDEDNLLLSNFLNDNYDVGNNDKPIYYVSEDVAEYAQELAQNKDLRMLFDAARHIKKEDMQLVYNMIKRFKDNAE